MKTNAAEAYGRASDNLISNQLVCCHSLIVIELHFE